jgi:hypothetical protein
MNNGVRGPGMLRSSPILTAPTILKSDPCLLILVNKTREGLTVHAESRTPHGSCFLDSLTADLDVGGVVTFFCCPGNDLHIDCSNGFHKLSIEGGELRLLPGLGFRQRMMGAGLNLPVKYLLNVEVEEVLESTLHVHSTMQEILMHHEQCRSLTGLASLVEKLPDQCTLLVPRILPRILASLCLDDLLKHLAIPVALFFKEAKGGTEVALDGSEVAVKILPFEKVSFEIGASVDAPAVKFQSSMEPLRCAERFQLIYLCE